MKVFIYRHTEAENTEPDEDRVLTDKGRSQVKKLSDTVSGKEFEEVSEIWHSPLTRAVQTAELFKASYPKVFKDVELHEVHELEPDSDVIEMGELLGKCEGDVLVCGHNPFLEELVTALCVGEPGLGLVQLKKGAMLCLERELDPNEYMPMGLWTINWLVVPRII